MPFTSTMISFFTNCAHIRLYYESKTDKLYTDTTAVHDRKKKKRKKIDILNRDGATQKQPLRRKNKAWYQNTENCWHVCTNKHDWEETRKTIEKQKQDNNATKAINEKRKIGQKYRGDRRAKQWIPKTVQRKMLNAKLLKRQNSVNTKQEGSYREMTVLERKQNTKNMIEKKSSQIWAKSCRKRRVWHNRETEKWTRKEWK